MATSDKIEKYLNKKATYKPVDTIDNVFSKSIDKAKKDQKKLGKKMDKMLIRDEDGNVFEMEDVTITESEDGVMAYLTAHPFGGRGRQGHRKGFTCPNCGKNIDLRKIKNEKTKAYQIKSKGTKNLVGNVSLKTAKEIHGNDIEEIDHKNGIVWLKAKSKYGR